MCVCVCDMCREVPPPEWDGSPGSTPLSFYLQAIGNISEAQPRIC